MCVRALHACLCSSASDYGYACVSLCVCLRLSTSMLVYLTFARYYDLELPVYLKKGYFFDASQVQARDHANVSKVLPNLLQGLTKEEGGTDPLLDLAISWRLHQMTAAGIV